VAAVPDVVDPVTSVEPGPRVATLGSSMIDPVPVPTVAAVPVAVVVPPLPVLRQFTVRFWNCVFVPVLGWTTLLPADDPAEPRPVPLGAVPPRPVPLALPLTRPAGVFAPICEELLAAPPAVPGPPEAPLVDCARLAVATRQAAEKAAARKIEQGKAERGKAE